MNFLQQAFSRHAAAAVLPNFTTTAAPAEPPAPESVEGAAVIPVAVDEAVAAEEGGAEPAAEDAEFEETLNAEVMSFEDFLALRAKRERIEAGLGVDEQLFWYYPRRWKVNVYGIKLTNLYKDELAAFLEFEIGSNRSEFRVAMGESIKVIALGEVGYRRRTYIIHPVSRDKHKPSKVDLQLRYEWQGSYKQLHSHKLRINLWKTSKKGLNELEGTHEESLINFTSTSTFISRILYKLTGGKRIQRCLTSFEFVFQEIFDFHLDFVDWHVSSGRNDHGHGEGKSDATLDSGGMRKSHWLLHIKGIKSLIGKAIHSPRQYSLQPYWGYMGTMKYRGTLMEVENSACVVSLIKGPFTQATEFGRGYLQFRGLLQRPHIRCKLDPVSREASIFFNHTEWYIEGNIKSLREPLYSQSGQILALNNEDLFLIVRIKNVDRIFTKSGQTLVNAQITVSYRGQTRSTRIMHNVASPTFDEDIAIPIYFTNIRELVDSEYPQSELIIMDLWSVNRFNTDHIGHVSYSLWDILYTKDGDVRPRVEKWVFDSYTMRLKNIQIPCLDTKESLGLSFESEKNVVLAYEAFMSRHLPDLIPCARPDLSTIPLPYKSEIEKYMNIAELLSMALPEALNRNFALTRPNRGRHILLPLFLSEIIPPKDISSPRAIFTYIRSIPFTEGNEGAPDSWASPFYLVHTRVGTAASHNILLTCLMLATFCDAYMVVGTAPSGQPVTGVLTLDLNHHTSKVDARLWGVDSGDIFLFPDRVKDVKIFRQQSTWMRRSARKEVVTVRKFFGLLKSIETVEVEHKDAEEREAMVRDSILQTSILDTIDGPSNGRHASSDGLIENTRCMEIRTIDLVFNNKNVWLNKQSDPTCTACYYDLWNHEYWHKVFPDGIKFECPDPPPVLSLPISRQQVDTIENELVMTMKFEIALVRNNMNLSCVWQTSSILNDFLRDGAQMRYHLDTCQEGDEFIYHAQIDQWKKALQSKVPPQWKLCFLQLQSPYLDAPKLASKLIESARSILEERTRLTMLAIQTTFYTLPGGFGIFYISLVSCNPLSENQKRINSWVKDRKQALRQVLETQNTNGSKETEMRGTEMRGTEMKRMEMRGLTTSGTETKGMETKENADDDAALEDNGEAEVEDEVKDEDEDEVEDEDEDEVEDEDEDDVEWEELYQRAKEMAPEEFEELYNQYLKDGYDNDSARYWASYYIYDTLQNE